METRRLTVVYAEDDDLMREATTDVLTQEDVDVHACASGAEALALCAQVGPDAVLLDLNMPDLDGLKTASALRADPAFRNLKLVALTGNGTWELRKKALDAGFDEFLTKPISTAALIGALQRR
jgi:CheY-like chemotaxis protein